MTVRASLGMKIAHVDNDDGGSAAMASTRDLRRQVDMQLPALDADREVVFPLTVCCEDSRGRSSLAVEAALDCYAIFRCPSSQEVHTHNEVLPMK